MSDDFKVKNVSSDRSVHEIEHGRMLAESETEILWGWGTPAGKVRAERRGALIISAANITPDHRVLEIGCGTGLFSEMFAQTGAEIIAVDISQDLISLAVKRNISPTKVKFLCQRFEDFIADKPFDAVIGSSVLHHLDIDSALNNIERLLKPGGWLAFAEPNMLNPQVFAERTFLRDKLGYVSPDETAFVRWLLGKKMTKVGFTEIKITPFDWLHPYTPSKLINLVFRTGLIIEKIPILREFSGSLMIRAQKSE
ncbi:MAG: class I SAM-dependent methyltransferase [Anaerolineales bacterium]|jgi:2-polyprenyl-3-methyl-5-hydroxy-6-metoxy-1,4-benzoquinol methylase